MYAELVRVLLPGDPAAPPGLLAFDLQLERVWNCLRIDDRQPRTTVRNIRDRAHDRGLAGSGIDQRSLVVAGPAGMFSIFYQDPVSLIRAGRCSRPRLRIRPGTGLL